MLPTSSNMSGREHATTTTILGGKQKICSELRSLKRGEVSLHSRLHNPGYDCYQPDVLGYNHSHNVVTNKLFCSFEKEMAGYHCMQGIRHSLLRIASHFPLMDPFQRTAGHAGPSFSRLWTLNLTHQC
jgi:hypothetical protein